MLKKLYLTKIFEGGVNLETGEHIPYGLMVSNGEEEVGIEVGEEAVNRISTLICGKEEKTPAKSSTNEESNVRVIPNPEKKVLGKSEEYAKEAPRLVAVPGSNYDDELTGVSSL